MALITTEAYDIVLDDDIGLMLARNGKPAMVVGRYKPSDVTQENIDQGVPVLWDDWSRGAFMSRRSAGTGGGYAYSDLAVGTTADYGSGAYARSPGLLLPAGAVSEVSLGGVPGVTTITDSFVLDSSLFFLCGRYAIRLPGGTAAPVGDADFGASVTADRAVVFDGGAIVSTVGSYIWKRAAGAGWTQSADVARGKMKPVHWYNRTTGVRNTVLVATDTSTTIRWVASGANPLVDANWTGQVQVGDTAYPIQSLAASAHHVYVVKQDGVYDLDDRGDTPLLTPWVRQIIDSNNGLVSHVFDGYIYYNTFNGLARYALGDESAQHDPGWCHPGAPPASNETPIFGQVTAMCDEGGWLAVAVWNGLNSYVCYGRDRRHTYEGIGPILWHGAEATFTNQKITHMRVDATSGYPRLWVATVPSTTAWTPGTTPRLFWISIPKGSSPLSDFNGGRTHTFGSSYSVYMTADDWGDGTSSKVLRRWDVETGNLAGGHLELFASANESGTYVAEGNITTSPYDGFLASPTMRATKVRSLVARVDGYGSPNSPAVIRAIKATAGVIVRQEDQIVAMVTMAEGQRLRNGSYESQDPTTKMRAVMALQEAAPVTMTDVFGRRLRVKVEPGISYTVGFNDQGQYQIDARVVFTILERRWYWDQGYLWDGGNNWP